MKLFSGIYTDFNMFWFSDIGAVIYETMKTYTYFPFVEWIGYYAMRHAKRMWDQRKFWPNDVMKTHCQTIHNFKNIYVGPTFLAHFKYAFVSNVIFVTFMYGLVMPILFPIAFLTLFAVYVSETLFLHYSYQRPPTFHNSITIDTLEMLQFAPSLMLLIGAYAFSNQQVFAN
jgi:hypothetical protein